MLRFDEFRALDGERFVKHFAELLRENDGNGSSIASVNRNRKRPGIAIIPVDRAVGFPNAVSMASRVRVVANEKNSCPKIFIERVLGFNGGEIIAGGNDAAVQDDEVTFVRREEDGLLGSATEGDAGEEDSGVITDFAERAKMHGLKGSGIYCCYSFYNTNAAPM